MIKDPFLTADDNARALARRLMDGARHGALGVLRDGLPFVTRIALAPDDASLITLVSDLAPHTQSLRVHPQASLLIGEAGKGDPLAHPRLTLEVRAQPLDKTESAQSRYLTHQPKARLYIEFQDFHLFRLIPTGAHLNAGFSKAYRLSPTELAG